jgi:hypothetical protein
MLRQIHEGKVGLSHSGTGRIRRCGDYPQQA